MGLQMGLDLCMEVSSKMVLLAAVYDIRVYGTRWQRAQAFLIAAVCQDLASSESVITPAKIDCCYDDAA